MTEYRLTPKALVLTAGSSAGTQIKYYENGWWYKLNQNGYEGTAEYLVSLMLACSNLSNYVFYESCRIKSRHGIKKFSSLLP